MRIELLPLLLTLAFVNSGSGQTPQKTSSTSPPEAAKQLRPRTTAESQSGEATQATTPQSATNPSRSPVKESSDPLAQLREQIDEAASGSERNTLRLKLVEELVAAGQKGDALSELRSLVNTDVFDPQ